MKLVFDIEETIIRVALGDECPLIGQAVIEIDGLDPYNHVTKSELAHVSCDSWDIHKCLSSLEVECRKRGLTLRVLEIGTL